jgi:hypothetical protein
MKRQWRNARGYIKSCYGKRIVKSHSILSQVSVNKNVNIGFNTENLFYKHKTNMKGVCDTLCMAMHYFAQSRLFSSFTVVCRSQQKCNMSYTNWKLLDGICNLHLTLQ